MARGKEERGAEREIKRVRCTLTHPLYCSLFQRRCATHNAKQSMFSSFTEVENVVCFLGVFSRWDYIMVRLIVDRSSRSKT